MNDQLAIDKRTALKMFYDAGFKFESDLIMASDLLESMRRPNKEYWLALDVIKAIESQLLFSFKPVTLI